DRDRDTQFGRKIEPIWIDVSYHYIAGAGMSYDGGRHDSYGSCAGDQYVLAQYIERERGVNRISKRVKAAENVQRNTRVCQPDVRLRYGKIFCKSPRAVDPYPVGLVAEMPATSQTVSASSTDYMAFARHNHPGLEIDHMTSNRFYDPNELVTNLHR